MTAQRTTETGLPAAARDYVSRWLGRAWADGDPIARLAGVAVRPDEEYCRAAAACYDEAPLLAYDAQLGRRYERFKLQNLRQYETIIDAGLEIAPWQGGDQPYEDSQQLCESVRETGRLYVYLTRSGHGPSPATGFHPLREPAGISAGGVEFCHNDVFRAVHDIFGHVMFGNGFGPKGEFLAAFCHLHMYSPDVHPVLFTEHVGQICWFFYGPHLMDANGALPRKGDPAYVPAARRPYPEQKVFPFPERLLDGFTRMFQLERSSDE